VGRIQRSRDTRRIGDLFRQLLPLGVVCALSPWAIVAVILMLASDRPTNAVAWLAGWTLSTIAIGVVIVFFLGGYDFSPKSTPTAVACVVQVLLGVLLLIAAVRFWARRPARTGKRRKEPGWMTRIGELRPLWAFLIGAFWINTTLVIAAGVDTLRANLSRVESIAVFAVFTLITMSVQGALILYAYVLPKHASIGLERIREWIARNQEPALALVALLLAIWFTGKGLRGLRG
jgi:Sap, sulfolipid-1-addressing protein